MKSAVSNVGRFDEGTGPLDGRLASGLAKIALAVRHELFRAAAPHGLSPVQAQVLVALSEGTALRVGELAARLGLTPATLSDSVAALERRRLVTRRRDAADGRGVLVRATRRGAEIGRSLALWPEFLVQALAGLPGEEKGVLLRAVVRLVRALIDRGVVQEARMCVLCRHFRPRVHDDPERPHHCALADVPFGDRGLRLDCPDHFRADDDVARARWRVFAGEGS
jgi:DNA-binding MarR family transcriptional regulator